MITRKELEDVLNQMNAIFERVERRLEKLEEAVKKPTSRPKKTT